MDLPASGERLLSIGEFSRLSRISIRMLRHYDEHDVLRPTRTDPRSGYRQYAAELLATAGRVRELRDVGLGVADLARCVRADPTELRSALERHRQDLSAEATAVERRLHGLDHLLGRLEAPPMSVDITRRTLPARTVASVRGTIPTYADEGVLWGRLMAGLAAAGAAPAPDAGSVAVFHDEEYVESGPDVEVQLDVTQPFASTGDVVCVQVPEQDVVVGVLRGSYEGMGAVTEAMGAWMAEHGLQMAGPLSTRYVVGPDQDHNPAAWVTEVRLPVAGT